MAIFKRFEVWLLLLLIAGAVWFVMQPPEDEFADEGDDGPEKIASVEPEKIEEKANPQPDVTAQKSDPDKKPKAEPIEKKAPTAEPEKVTTSPDRFEIETAKRVAEDGGQVVEISVIGRSDKAVELTEAKAKLVTESGEKIDRFFLPFDAPPILEVGESKVDLKFWATEDLKENEKLWLEIDGDRVAVDLGK